MKAICPACGHSGELRGTDEFFEPRGQHPQSRMPVRRCRSCGAGFEARPRFFVLPFLGVKTRQIPDHFWSQMEEVWEREFGAECDTCGKTFPSAALRDRHVVKQHPTP